MQIPFMTGFPGFITTQLITQLIRGKKAQTFYLLVLKNQMTLAKQTVEQLQTLGDVKFHLIEGDITQVNLGLLENDFQSLKEQVNTVWHLAAIYDLAVPKNIAWKVNVHGTINVLETIKSFPHLNKFVYFSTAYVAGNRTGLLKEEELIRPKAFKNYYEETKFEAEALVRNSEIFRLTTIIRPGIVRGHSVTGETIKFDGPYFFVNMIDRLKWLPIIPYIGETSAKINVVPIDYIMNASVYLSDLEAANGKTVHLSDPNPHYVKDVYKAMVKYITKKEPIGKIPISLATGALSIAPIRKYLGVEKETLQYLTWDAHFDTTVAQLLLEGSGIECADFLSTIPSMINFYNENKSNKQFHVKID